ncbi:MAG: DUF1638 domain-containing protein [Desulfobacterales bacterium]|nr:MAG: DUF1638 domain-containing protein [Desulfobacterales bacterium]
MPLHIIACGVFRDALEQIALERFYPNVAITYITPVLHNHPQKLKEQILNQVHLAKKTGGSTLCLYGRCHPELDDYLSEMNIPRIPGEHCYEILLGSRRFNEIIEQDAGTYFVEKDLILNFFEYCIQPLELDDPLLRKRYFQHYTQLTYIRQPLDPDNVRPNVHDISRLLDLKTRVVDADYTELKTNLLKLLSSVHRE